MIHVKATCKSCEGTGYSTDFGTPSSLFCKDCKGAGVLILTAENWDIELGDGPILEREGGQLYSLFPVVHPVFGVNFGREEK